jgi:hypothetical protein
MDDQVQAAQRLLPIIIGAEESSTRFTEIFRTAPVWLLQFTGTSMDARMLKFHLPDISQRISWGSAGFKDARRWPLLPLGVMTAMFYIAIATMMRTEAERPDPYGTARRDQCHGPVHEGRRSIQKLRLYQPDAEAKTPTVQCPKTTK